MNTSGVTCRIFNFADCLVGHIKGGLGHANVVASMIFAGMSGAAVADAAGLGTIEIEAMKKAGYDIDFFRRHYCGFIHDWADYSSGVYP